MYDGGDGGGWDGPGDDPVGVPDHDWIPFFIPFIIEEERQDRAPLRPLPRKSPPARLDWRALFGLAGLLWMALQFWNVHTEAARDRRERAEYESLVRERIKRESVERFYIGDR